MKQREIQYVFQVEHKSCAPGGGWVRKTEFVTPNNGNPYEIAGKLAASGMSVTETGVRVVFLGLRQVGCDQITDMGGFTLELQRHV